MTKAQEDQWGPREDRMGKKYTAVFALEDLLDHGHIEAFAHDSYQRSSRSHLQYFHVRWDGDEEDVQTAVHATDYLDPNGGLPFGIERELIQEGIVSEVLILCGNLGHYYRVLASDWGMIDPKPESRERFTSVIDSSHIVSASGASLRKVKVELASCLNDTL